MTRCLSAVAAMSAVAAAVALAACTTAPTPVGEGPPAMSLRFAAQVDGQPFTGGLNDAGIGTTRATIMPNDDRICVGDVALVDEAGRAVPVILTAMFWNRQRGCKLVKFDTASRGQPSTIAQPDPSGSGNASGFSVHLGSTACASPSRTEAPKAKCANPNRETVAFERFDATRQTVVAGANVGINAPGPAAFEPSIRSTKLHSGDAP